MTEIKVAYLIVMRSFPGLLKQVEYDRALTQELDGFAWDHFTFLDQVEKGGSAQRLPVLFRGVFGRKLFAWVWLLKHAPRYDYVIMRHMEFDPFALIFAWFVPNRILVHHAKEVAELRVIRNNWKGILASKAEHICGRVAVRTARALLCVMREICDYQRATRGLPDDFPIQLFPNGVIIENVPMLEDDRRKGEAIEIGYMAGRFAPWHGLDILLDTLLTYGWADAPYGVTLHLIGGLNDEQLAHVERVNAVDQRVRVVVHGRMVQEEYRKIFGRCHVGIGSLAMYRSGVAEGATLKVREMLAMGLPVFSGHIDTALPEDFPYYIKDSVTMDAIFRFALTMEEVSRETVREAARPYIDKRVWIRNLADFLRQLKRSQSI